MKEMGETVDQGFVTFRVVGLKRSALPNLLSTAFRVRVLATIFEKCIDKLLSHERTEQFVIKVPDRAIWEAVLEAGKKATIN